MVLPLPRTHTNPPLARPPSFAQVCITLPLLKLESVRGEPGQQHLPRIVPLRPAYEQDNWIQLGCGGIFEGPVVLLHNVFF